MDVHLISSVQDHLVSSLNFAGDSGTANYILGTRQVSIRPESGDVWSPTARVCRFRLSESAFIDLASIRLGMTIYNTTVVATTGTERAESVAGEKKPTASGAG